MRCLIIDDEPLAAQLLTTHISQIDYLVLEKTCTNALDALAYLRYHQVDLLFLDIQMPKLNGISLLNAIAAKPKVIMTTAYRDYAVDAYNLDVVDYLLKPISFERFLKAIGKAGAYNIVKEQGTTENKLVHDFNDAYIYLRQDKEMIKIHLKDIDYIESLRDYVKVVTSDQQIITYNKISSLQQKLPENKFLRIHRSYIVALDRIRSFSSAQVRIDGHIIPIGRNYKNEALKLFNRHNIFEGH